MPRNKSKMRNGSGNESSTTTQESCDTTSTYGLEEEQIQKKNTAKNRKRELESQYGSAPLDNSMNDSKKSGKSKNSYGGDESFELDELVKQLPRQSTKNTKKRDKGKSKKSNNHSQEQSFAVDDLVVQPPRRPKPPRPSKSESIQGVSRGNSGHFSSSDHLLHHSSRPTMPRGRSANRNDAMMQGSLSQSRQGRSLSRGTSQRPKRVMSLDRSSSISGTTDHNGARRGIRPGLTSQGSARPGMASQGSHRPGLVPQRSLRPGLPGLQKSIHMQSSRTGLRPQMSRNGSGLNGSHMIYFDGNGSAVIAAPAMRRSKSKGKTGMRRFIPKDDDDEKPARSIVLIWIIVAAELGFDLGTTIIAFRSFLEEDSCCGNPISLGSITMGSTIPFFLLVVAELTFLIRAISLTMWPSTLVGGDDSTDMDDLEDPGNRKQKRSAFSKYCCCILRFKVRVLLQILNFLVLLNPFFGCIVAWILMYQSDETEAFTVLGLEGASLILHFLSVYLEGTFGTWRERIINCIPLIPFFISIGLVLYYLKQGGVCYLVEDRLFKFTGCEICNISGVLQPCTNGTNIFNDFNIDNLDTFDKIKDTVLGRTLQGSYCSVEQSFCFFDYDDGQQPPVNGEDSTNYPTEEIFATQVPVGDSTDPPVPEESEEPEPAEDPTAAPVTEPTDPPETPSPTRAPIASTPNPTTSPTARPTASPTPAPVQEEEEPEPDSGGGDGSDGFDMDEIGSDGFNPNEMFGTRQLN